ncbi:MAG: glycosyltransferase family 2 protein [Frankiaceae bacterium]|nr:glycosyltransferase family 2 protein [Frankiaceae bacterium]
MKANSPMVSIVLPAFRNARFIERAVDSALAQTFMDFELIIADHSSDDGTWEALGRYGADPRVRLERTAAGGGAQRNWNRVTGLARGTYVKLLCGDDVIYPTCVADQVAALAAHPSAALAAVRRDLIDPDDAVLLRGRGLGGLRGLVEGTAAIRAIVRAGANLLGEPACVLIRADVLRAIGGWSDAYPYLIDQYTYMRALEHGDLVALDTVGAAFRLSDTQWSVRLATQQGAQARDVHRHFRRDLPGVITAWDERIGTARAYRTAWARRTAYFVWRRRMRSGRP